MNFDELKDQFTGEWTGTNRLRLGEPDDRITSSELKAEPVVGNKFLSLTYTWSFDGAPHEGLMIVGYDRKEGVATASWVDSWHQSAKVLLSEGVIHDHGEVDVKGYYGTPGERFWGWRTTLKMAGSGLLLEMYNCSPEGGKLA